MDVARSEFGVTINTSCHSQIKIITMIIKKKWQFEYDTAARLYCVVVCIIAIAIVVVFPRTGGEAIELYVLKFHSILDDFILCIRNTRINDDNNDDAKLELP